jgi:hypothetical protein
MQSKRCMGVILAALLGLAVTVSGQNDQKKDAGSITASGQSVCLPLSGAGTGQVQLSGTWTGTITWKATARLAVATTPYRAINAADGTAGTTTTGNGLFTFGAAGLAQFCAEATAAITGTVTVDIRVSAGTGLSTQAGGAGGGGDASAANQVTGNASLASIDTKTPALVSGRQPVDGSGVTQPVSGTFWQATQPVSLATAPTTPVTGTFWQATQPVSGTFWQPTQPVSGTVTSNAGTNLNTSALALSATQTDRSQKTQITDGTRDGTVKAASTAAQAADTSLVVGLSPNSPLPAGTAVIGHVIADSGSTTAVTGNVTVQQATGTNLHAVIDTGSTTAVTQATAANLNATVAQGAAAAAANRWPVTVSDGTNTMPTADVAARAQFGKVTDGTNTAAVKAASTAAAAADPSLVVGLSPNSPLPAGTNAIGEVTQAQKIIDDVAPVSWDASTNGGVAVPVTAADGATGTLNISTLGAGCATLWMLPSATDILTGVVAFDVLPRLGGTWVELSGSNGDKTFIESDLNPHTTAYNGTYAGWRFPVQTFRKIRIRLKTPITGTSSISVWGTSVSEGCAPFGIARQGDPSRLNVSARNYTSDSPWGATWTSATAADTRATVTVTSLSSVFITIRPTGTITGGVITTELSDNGSDWFAAPGGGQLSLAGMATASQQSLTISVPAATTLAVRLVTQITGSSSPGISLVMIASSGAPVRTSTVNYKTGFTLTTAPLGISGVYTSAWFDNQNDGGQAVVCYARSNQASAASGFAMQQTTDTTDSNFTITAYSTGVAANTTQAAFANTYQRFWRVVYTNGGTGQTTFKIVCSINPVQFTLTDAVGVTYTNPTIYTAYDAGVSSATTQRVVQAQERTYAAATTAKTATANGTAAFLEVCGSASTTVRIQRIVVSGTVATAAVYGDLVVRKNSSALTGGTATTLTGTPYDSNSAAATATAKYFTALPTGGGTLVGTIHAGQALFPLTGTPATYEPQLDRAWRDTDAEIPVLRGVAQCIAVGFGTAPGNAPTLAVSVVWTEK